MLGISEPSENQLEWNELALLMAEKSNDPKSKKWVGSLYNNIGWTYHDRKEYPIALDHFQRALLFRETQGDPQNIL